MKEITCTYSQMLVVSYVNGVIKHELPATEVNPMIFTFSEFDGDSAKLKFIDATRTISEVSIVKLLDSKEKLVFLEGGSSYISTHTIAKADGISIYAKEVSLLGIPVGTLSMGSCISY